MQITIPVKHINNLLYLQPAWTSSSIVAFFTCIVLCYLELTIDILSMRSHLTVLSVNSLLYIKKSIFLLYMIVAVTDYIVKTQYSYYLHIYNVIWNGSALYAWKTVASAIYFQHGIHVDCWKIHMRLCVYQAILGYEL